MQNQINHEILTPKLNSHEKIYPFTLFCPALVVRGAKPTGP